MRVKNYWVLDEVWAQAIKWFLALKPIIERGFIEYFMDMAIPPIQWKNHNILFKWAVRLLSPTVTIGLIMHLISPPSSHLDLWDVLHLLPRKSI